MNLDYVRLIFAAQVMLVHAGFTSFGSPLFNSEIAVLGFFCISGYLITLSYLNSKSLEQYVAKRAIRLFPPILTTVIFLLIAGLYYQANQDFYRGVIALLTFQDWSPISEEGAKLGVYAHGAFWTLVVEFQFYLVLPFVVQALKRRERIALFGLVIAYVAAHFLRRYIPPTIPALAYRQSILSNAHFFIAGILTAYYRPKIYEWRWFPALAIFAVFIHWKLAYLGDSVLTYMFPFALLAIVLALGRLFRFLGDKAFFGDLSYGIYLYHFPIITALGVSIRDASPEEGLTIVTATCVFALLSWHLLEKRLLSRLRSRTVTPRQTAI